MKEKGEEERGSEGKRKRKRNDSAPAEIAAAEGGRRLDPGFKEPEHIR